jgi:putative ABC transport system permease protein
MRTLWQDLRYGARMLWKRPGFTIIAVLTLALGIGANTAIFSVINAVLLRALPYSQPEQLVSVTGYNPVRGWTNAQASLHDVLDWRTQNHTLAKLAVFNPGSVNLSGGTQPERVAYARVTGDFFAVLGAEALLGRTLQPADDQPGRGNVVVLSHGFWQRYFGGDREVIGKTLTVDGTVCEVVGVMPPHVQFPNAETQLWKPIALKPETTGARDGRWLQVVGRLKPDVTLAQAQAEMELIAGNLAAQYPNTNKDWTVRLTPLETQQTATMRTVLLLLWGAVALVLLIACANVANLLLARAAQREKEIAVRSALGAGRWRIVRQLLTESLLLAVAGGTLGLLLAWWSVGWLARLSLGDEQREAGLDGRVLLYSLGLSLLTGIVFGLVPAFKASATNLTEVLKEGRRGLAGSLRQRTRSLLVVGEIALTLVLLVGAGLLLRSFVAVLNVNAGFDPQHLLTMRIAPPQAQPRPGEADEAFFQRFAAERQQMASFYRTLMEQVRTLPGVEAAGVINRPPLGGNWWGINLQREGSDERDANQRVFALARVIDPGYLQALRVPLLQGRTLTDLDHDKAQKVAVINQTMAHRYWPNENPLGQRLVLRKGMAPLKIVGIVGDVRYSGLEAPPDPTLYVPFAQAVLGHWGDWGMTLAIRTSVEPTQLANAVRAQVQTLAPTLPLYAVSTMQQVLDEATTQRRANLLLLGLFAGLALLLAVIGMYGVISYSVGQRTREFGLRLALGAHPREVLALVLREGLVVTLLGITVGLAASWPLARFLATQLYETRTHDPLTFVAVPLLLLLVTLLACWIPGRRATRVDPMVALRCEG